MRSLIFLLMASFLLSGCSVVMALHGQETKNIGSIRIGTPRDIVITKLGNPESSRKTANGRIDVYELQRGNEKSIGRALYYAIADAVTFGFHEIIGTTAEAMKGKTIKYIIEYNIEDKVRYFRTEEK